MNTDPKLKNLFNTWKVEVEVPSRFRSEVWKRIEERKAIQADTLWAQLKSLVMVAFAQPRYAVPLIALLIGVGSIFGMKQGENHLSNLQAKYVQSIDPYAQVLERNP